MKYAVCEDCGLVAEAEVADVGICIVGLYHHCGLGHECTVDELFDNKKEALEAAANACA